MNELILPKFVSVGIYNAQIAYKNKVITPNRKTTMFELELPIGDGGDSHIDDNFHPISENVVICAKPGQTRHTRLPFRCYYIHIIVKEGLLYDVLTSLPDYIEMQDTTRIRELFAGMCEHHRAGEELMLQSLVLELIFTLTQHAPFSKTHTPKSNHQQLIGDTLEYINNNLSADLRLEALCERAGFTPVYFHKLFKASTGKKLHEYVEEQRIKKAVDLLISTDMSLAQIAYECGFSSQSYFSYAFKRCKGISPRSYAKKVISRYEKQ